ncbi:glycine cleavage system aminomethyltransferase GcvT [Opitutus sp. ER46]|uniref:glycine cleavage system aminomethyltransferase GcvT n=1 Tax=Opitutus sp. ER46 TaxID=2161864 RepID=UPI000D324E1E|nr:glycine cleavage system aminomethyltransferase GcvT [Opitutus sp. ER46]PTY00352.1 glycine cleavage system aminomethyltransferase GcvT [Opitutus sp. ER46]
MNELKRTPLRDFHAAHGARLVDFAGWEMPVQYRSILEEHKAVRRTAGLFDVSHMGEVDVRGPEAGKFLDHLVTNSVARLFPGRVLYSPMCYPAGGVVDDLLVYMHGTDDYFLCINAGNIDKDLAWIRGEAAKFNVTVTDRSADYALLAVQGPRAAEIVQSLTGAKLGLVKYYHFTEATVAGVRCIVSRTGYTGEDGFELYHATGDAQALAQAVLDAGTPRGLELAGLGARDSLRLEAGYPLYGHEITAEISPLTAGLGWTVKLDKPDFIGREALLREKQNGGPNKVVFFKTGDRRIVRAETPVLGADGAVVGHVLSGTLSPILNEAIGSALVATPAATQPLAVDIRGARLGLQLVTPPFVPLKKS